MDKEQEYNRLLDSLIIGTDMEDEVSRKMGYNACLAYTKQELTIDLDVNRFIALAAERFGQVRVHFGIIKGMVAMPENARLHLRYAPQGGPVLTGNAAGLHYLSELCQALSEAPLANGEGPEEHIHLYDNEPPMVSDSYGLTVYHSSDIWFDHQIVASENTESVETTTTPPPREIAPEQISAIEFFEDDRIPLPPFLYLRYDKLYRVLDCRPYLPGEDVWGKPFPNEDDSRVHTFKIRDDAQEIFEIGLHLDDSAIHYFTQGDLEQVWQMGNQ